MNDPLAEHRRYVTDANRIDAYRRALRAVVRPDDVVLDLGAGTGVLGLLACEAGARRVYAVDEACILELARAIARSGPYADRIIHVPGHSSWITLSEAVDVIVADQIGNFGFEAGVFDDVPAAARRHLRPGGRIVPRRVDLVVAPVALPEVRGMVDMWRQPVAGFDMSAAAPVAAAAGYVTEAPGEACLGSGAPVTGADITPDVPPMLAGTAVVSCERAGRMDGLLGWFRAELAPGVMMTNEPGCATRIDRRPLFLPTDPVDVREGDRVHVDVALVPAAGAARWSVTVLAADGTSRGVSRHDTLEGAFLSAERLRRVAPTTRPGLSREGEARLEVLRRCDGTHTVAEIEQALAARFPDRWPTPRSAGPFVAEVLLRHGR